MKYISDNRVLKFAELYALSAAKRSTGTTVSGDLTFMGYSLGYPSLKRDRQVGELYSQLSHILLTDITRSSAIAGRPCDTKACQG